MNTECVMRERKKEDFDFLESKKMISNEMDVTKGKCCHMENNSFQG